MKRIMIALLLAGCVAKTPTQTVIDHHIQLVDEALASEDMSDKAKSALKTCKAGLVSAEETYRTELSEYKADVRYWKAVSSFMFIIMILYFGYKVMKR